MGRKQTVESTNVDPKALERAAFSTLFPAETIAEATLAKMSPALRARFDAVQRGGVAEHGAPSLSDEAVQAMVTVIRGNFTSLFEAKRNSDERIAALANQTRELGEILRSERRPPTQLEIKLLDSMAAEREQLQKDFAQKTGQERDFYYAVHRDVLLAFGTQLRTGRIAEVPYTRAVIEKIVRQLELGETAFLHGDTGSGKTEAARVAAKLFSGKEPIVVRGYPGMAQEELFGHLTLKADGLSRAADVVQRIVEEVEYWKKKNTAANSAQQGAAEETITKRVLSENRVTTLDYVLGAQYLAMKAGRVIIYDEANAIPAALRRKLNDLKTKREGEIVTVQEDGGLQFPVAKGYGQIETANLGKRYGEGVSGRFAFSPDEHDRRQSYIECDYLPQAVKGSIAEITLAEQKQLFTIAVAALIDSNGNLVAPQGTLQRLWTLAQYAALTQQAFAGTIAAENQFMQGGVRVPLRTDVLISPRGLQSILNAWRSEGYRHELDHYLAENLLSRTTDPNQRAYLYQLGQTCGLFTSEGWVDNPQFQAGAIAKFSVQSPANKAGPTEVVSFVDVVEAIWGAAPARSEYPRSSAGADAKVIEETRIKEFQALTGAIKEIDQVLVDSDLPTKDREDGGVKPAPKMKTLVDRLLGRKE